MVTRDERAADDSGESKPESGDSSGDGRHTADPADTPADAGVTAAEPREIGGRKGPDPTRYGDWEKGGRCIDF